MAEHKANQTDTIEPMILSQQYIQNQGARRFFSSGRYSDLTITCKGREWKVHKFQVCAQSEFFDKTCSGQFKEAKQNQIDLLDDDPLVVEAMLYYFYHGTYGDPGNGPGDSPSIVLDARMFAIADKYFIQPLKAISTDRFIENSRTQWDSPSFAQAIAEVYEGAPDDSRLKKAVLAAVKEHMEDLLSKSDTYPDFHKLLREMPELGADILVDLVRDTKPRDKGCHCIHIDKKRKAYEWTFTCPDINCLSVFTVNIPLGKSVTFSCPSGHHSQNFGWWWDEGRRTA